VDMGLPPGEIRIVPPSRIGGLHLSTHGLPLSVLMEYIRVEGRKVMLIGVQPRRLHGSMSDEVKQAGEELVRRLVNGRVDELEVL
ncbi:MAG TPA: hydrogenase maturation peptidase HycI, partial [Thermoplasmatales archaeon]|nr:hydrogenase maturation peptidase HycI [Thermoplasmatales archaeon]